MDDAWWILGVRLAGGFHLVTLALAWFTPVPANWEENLARLPEMHRRFSLAQNLCVGATTVVLGLISLGLAPSLVDGSPLARAICGATALFWGGRLAVLPWIGIGAELKRPLWRFGFGLLVAECAIYALAYGWLAVR